ncbi:unnamed protein product [Haemonchus placei]|uniref:C2 domain-containing protein n=1 Tax=Haemonchus placei TaxID=6290 RepID=A0A3P7XES6_HAEPC|nr:unnamed protein product [Haemonchus placei]
MTGNYDPMCVVSQFVGRLTGIKHSFSGKGKWLECGRTECVKNTLDPEWASQIRIEYFFEERQTMRFEIYDIDAPTSELSAHDFLGRMECELAEIVANRPFTKALSGTKRKNHGELTVSCDEVDDGAKENVRFHLSAKKLDKKDFFGKSDPFLNIYRIDDGGNRQLAHRTEAIKRELNPVWNPFEVNVKMLCSNDYKRYFKCSQFSNMLGEEWVKKGNFDANPSVVGVRGVMEAYRYALNRVTLYGPTNFKPVIQEVAKKASRISSKTDGSRYQVRARDRNGWAHESINPISGASSLPLSIIIVGVGNDEFENMNELDSDSHLLTHAGRTAHRDIVQFVPLRNFLREGCTGAESERVMGLLAKEVLAEVPLQLTSYMKMRNIVPRPADDPFPKDPEAGQWKHPLLFFPSLFLLGVHFLVELIFLRWPAKSINCFCLECVLTILLAHLLKKGNVRLCRFLPGGYGGSN